MKQKVLLAWSSGKDSALTLHELQKSDEYEVVALLTTLTEDYDRISMHGVRRTLLEKQAESIGLPLLKVLITKNSDNDEYEARMGEALAQCREQDIFHVAFGDIFLEDLKQYREDNLAKVGMKGVFPIWKQDTKELARTFIDRGFKSVITCVDTAVLDGSFAGRTFNEQFVADLPEGIDPCGENGEFHSFAYAGPIFKGEIPHKLGTTVLRENRWCFCDVIDED